MMKKRSLNLQTGLPALQVPFERWIDDGVILVRVRGRKRRVMILDWI